MADRTWLTAHRREIEQERRRWSQLESRWSWARLFVFLVGVVPWLFLVATPLIPTVLTAAAAVAFLLTVKRHHACRDERELRDGMLVVLDESLRRCGGGLDLIRSWQRPAGTTGGALGLPAVLPAGPVWPMSEQERDDLDIFGAPIGLFGLLNRTSTRPGAWRLRDMIEWPCLSAERILARQAAVRWLEEHPERRIRMMGAAVGLRVEDRRLAGFARALDRARPLKLFVPVAALRVWGVITAILVALALGPIGLGHFKWGWLIAAVAAVNAAILKRIGCTLTDALAPWRDVEWGVRAFLAAVKRGAVNLPDETELATLRECFAGIVEPGYMPGLCRRIRGAERAGGLHVALNCVALYDVHVAAAILKRVLPNRAALLAGVSALAELDALASLACFAAEQPVRCYPRLRSEAGLRITGGVHPLIPPERVVANDVEVDARCRAWIITGSNMAGKTTFLRMVGLNVLLAQIGSAVAAREMVWRPLLLMTDLQARDNLARDESYFLAEVRHLHRMVRPPAGDHGLLALIDEPFRGTSSREQSAASVAVVRHMLASSTFILLATHDRSLTELADGDAVRNFHFREDLGRDGLVFDYCLHEGPARTRNALRVLEREGYPPGIVDDARAWLRAAGETEP